MTTVDNRNEIYELEEIYKYKSLIEQSDRDVIKQIIYSNNDKSTAFYHEFIKLVTMEIDHQLNKEEFYKLKDQLIIKMQDYLQN